MLTEQPPNSVRSVGTRKETFTRCSWSASRVSPKRPWYCMILSKAIDPQISAVLVMLSPEILRIENDHMVAGRLQSGEREVQPDRLLRARGETGGGRHALQQVVGGAEHAAQQRLVVGVGQLELDAG